MGAIQGAINQAMASAAVAGRMITDEKERNINAGEAAVNKVISLNEQEKQETETKNKNWEIAKNAAKDIKTLTEMGHNLRANGINTKDDAKAFGELLKNAFSDREAANVAMNTAMDKIEAIKEMRERAFTQIKKGRSWGGNY